MTTVWAVYFSGTGTTERTMKVRCPLLCVHVSFVLVYMDLKRFNTETFLAPVSL